MFGRERLPGEGESIGVQAARFSLYVPIAVMMIGCFTGLTRGAEPDRKDAGVNAALGWLSIAMIVAGLLLGVFALASMRRFGRKGILVRAIGGVLLNGAIVGLWVSVLWPIMQARVVEGRLVGTWHMTSPNPVDPALSTDVALRADKTFTIDIARPDGARSTLTGRYLFARGDRTLGVDVQAVQGGDETLAGKKIRLGRVVEVDDKRMRLATDRGDELYERR